MMMEMNILFKNIMMATSLVAALGVTSCSAAYAETTSSGTITINISEYEKLKKAVETQDKDQWWNMTFEQILDKKNNDTREAWELYEYYVLRTVHLDSEVSGSTVDSLIQKMEVLNQISDKPITMVIDSPGGSVFAGYNLYNYMMDSKAPINTVCDGMAASMAAVILSAGDHRVAKDGCVFLIHEMAGGAGSGNTTSKLEVADWYMTIENVLAKILSENSGISLHDLRELWAYQTFFNAEETMKLGFVDEVVSSKPRDLAPGSRKVPEELMPKQHIRRNIDERLDNN